MCWAKWDLVFVEKRNKGIDICGIKSFNLTLIHKSKWRFITKEGVLWVNVVQALHNMDGGFRSGESWVRGSRVGIRLLRQFAKWILFLFTLRKLSIGDKTKLWIDRWVGDITLKNRFHRTLALETNKECLIRDRKDNNLWNCRWRRSVHGGIEKIQLHDLLELIYDFVKIRVDDRWVGV